MRGAFTAADARFMQEALRLARRGYGTTSPNPMVGALLVRGGRVLGRGWHQQAGGLHAEVAVLEAARAQGHNPAGATLYVTLEPCSTHGRTPPCTAALIAARVRRVIVAATDPNPAHAGHGYALLTRAGVQVRHGLLAAAAARLNESFNHWIVHRSPFVTVKAALTLDGKIATADGESQWITGDQARSRAMRLRAGADAVLVGIETLLADDPRLTIRPTPAARPQPWRIVLDARARTPLSAHLVSDEQAGRTILVVSRAAPARRVARLRARVEVWVAPAVAGRVRLPWLLERLGRREITSLLVEGGGEVNAAFLMAGLVQRVAFSYAPRVLGGRSTRKAVAGQGAAAADHAVRLEAVQWRRLGRDWLLTGRVQPPARPARRAGFHDGPR